MREGEPGGKQLPFSFSLSSFVSGVAANGLAWAVGLCFLLFGFWEIPVFWSIGGLILNLGAGCLVVVLIVTLGVKKEE